MSANAPAPPAPDGWLVSSLRLTAFPAAPAFESSREWWQGLIGSDPETSVERRQKSEREASGILDGTALALSVDLLRVTWACDPPAATDAQGHEWGIENIGRFVDRREWFSLLMQRWLGECHVPIKRLAFGGVIVQPTPDHPAAYEQLNRYLRCVDLDPASTDFLYRINRKRQSRVLGPATELNRLTTWMALKKVTARVLFSGGQAVIDPAPEAVPVYAARLEFDFNTSAERTDPLPQESLGELFAELTDLALETATHGDSRG